MNHDVYVRAHTVRVDAKPSSNTNQKSEPKWSDYALVWDVESRVTADQTLTFGFWHFCELRNGIYVATEEGILHDNGISGKEIALLRHFAKANEADTTEDSYNRIRVYSHSRFIPEVFGMAIQAKAFIVGFQCGYDLGRLGLDWNPAQNGGWTLIMKQWRNPKTGKVEPDESFPRVVINALNSKASIITSTRAPLSLRKSKGKRVKLWPRARFVDLRTLLWALRNKSYSLKSACKEFKTAHQKIDHTPTGKVTIDEIEYARGDVACTVDLLNAVKQEFDLHPIAAGPDRMFSPASVAKSYLEQLNVLHPCEKLNSVVKVTTK